MKDLSIVVPVYNVQAYLRRCLDSIVNQTLLEKEVILVDDGSQDASGEIADEYAAKYPYIKVVHQNNAGLSAARNTGIEQAQGEYIAFIDSDDYVESNMYQELLSFMQEKNADMVEGAVWYEQESGEKETPYPKDITRVWNTQEALIELNSYRYFNMSACVGIFKRSLFEDDGSGRGPLRFPVGKLCEDYYLMHKIIARTEKVAYTSKPYYHYIQRSNSISRNKKINMAPMDASMQQLDFYQKNFPEIAYVAETACAFSHMGIYSAHLRQNVECPHDLLKKLRKVSRRYLGSVLQNQYIPLVKKIQAITFCYMLPVYRCVIKRTKHR